MKVEVEVVMLLPVVESDEVSSHGGTSASAGS